MKINISELKTVVSKLNLAIEKAKLNPKSGWIELESIVDGNLSLKVCNYDYALEALVKCNLDVNESLHTTISADTFIPLVSKLDETDVDISISASNLILTTSKSEYTFPSITELGTTKSVDFIKFDESKHNKITLSAQDIASIASSNVKGLADSIISNDLQQYIYIDNYGAITFTENIYINDFTNPNITNNFKILLNYTQAKLLDVFKLYDSVDLYINNDLYDYENPSKIEFKTDNLRLVFILVSKHNIDKFPESRLRNIANNVRNTHVIIDKKLLDKALARLMVFDKKFDITVLNYSELVWGLDSVKLVSIKNRNYEIIPYISSENAFEHKSMIRFADLVKQLKAINSKNIDISYGDTKAIAINGDILLLIPEIVLNEKI